MIDTPEEKKTLSKKLIRAVLWMALITFLGCGVVSAWFLSYVVTTGPETDALTSVVDIPKGTSSKEIGRLLAEKRLHHDGCRFLILVRLMGDSVRLQAGEFRLHSSQTPVELIKELSRAKPVAHAVTIPEGLRIEEIAARFAKGGWVDPVRFIEAARDPALIESFQIGKLNSLEGYLFPETYHLTKSGSDEIALITMMVEQSLAVWKNISSENHTGLGRNDVYTLASIIEKESGKDAERPVISAVFHNRLKKKMRLQSDPTVIYGIENFDGKLSRTQLKTPTPYNTYTIPALPPGPICSPGKQSLKAVLLPAEADYLYFVSKNNGTHYFSKTLAEHNRAVRKYQRNKKKKTDA